jgi:hypothetical protein
MVTLLYSAEALVRVVGVQPMGFWGLWCQFVTGAVVLGRNGCAVVGVVAGEGFSCAVDEVVDGEGFGYVVMEVVVGEGFDPAELPVFAPTDGECRGCILA